MASVRIAAAGIALLLAASAPAIGQPAPHRVSDPNRLFSVALPGDWQVADPAIGETMLGGLNSLLVGYRVLSEWAADSVPDAPPGSPVVLEIVALDPPQPQAPDQAMRTLTGRLSSNWTVTGGGPAAIAGRAAYDAYCQTKNTGTVVYMMLAYFTAGRTGLAAVGSTYGEPPAAIQKDFARIFRILETFKPGAM